MTTTATRLNGVLDRLDRQCGLYASLRELSVRQGAILAAEAGAEELLDLLGRKQSVLAEIEALDAELGGFKREWRLHREQFDPVERVAVDERLSELHRLLGELIAMEEASREHFERPAPTPAPRTRDAQRAYGTSRRAG